MTDLLAKKYAKALLEGRDTKEIISLEKELSFISEAYNDKKFITIISSPEILKEKKEELIFSFSKKNSKPLINLIKLLSVKKRLGIVPDIVKELKLAISKINNEFEGTVYTKKEISSKYLKSIEEKFSKKLDVKLSLKQEICDYNGVKVDIDALGLELGFSKDRLKSQMTSYILQAI